jgi:hypothetical protein
VALVIDDTQHFLVAARHCIDEHKEGLLAQVDVPRVGEHEDPVEGVVHDKLLDLGGGTRCDIRETPKGFLDDVGVALV